MNDSIDLRAINAELKAQGRRICPCCGRNLPLDADHYYPKRNKKGLWTRWSSDCRECVKARVRERGRERYRKSKTYRQRKAEYRRAWFALPENRERHRARNRMYMQTKRREQRRAHFTAVLVKGSRR